MRVITALGILILVSLAFSYSSFIVLNGSSMFPAYQSGDMIQKINYRFEDVKVGDVISFEVYDDRLHLMRWENPLNGTKIVHRVAAILDGADYEGTFYEQYTPTGKFLVTKGDNNRAVDFFFTDEEHYLGIVITPEREVACWLPE